MRVGILLAALGLAALLVACGDGSVATPGSTPTSGSSRPATGENVAVEADMLSGRPNPTWNLSAADSDAVASCLRSAQAATDAPIAEPGLGFRRFILTQLPSSAGFSSVDVYPTGVVAHLTSGSRRLSGASCGSLFALLRHSAESQLSPDLLTAIPTT
jgi:hypothetical protein